MTTIARVACAAALALACAPATAKSSAHNGWQCEVEGDWIRVYFEPGEPQMADGFTLAERPARPLRLSYDMLIGSDAFSSYASFSFPLPDDLKVANNGEKMGVFLARIDVGGTRVARSSREAGVEGSNELMSALRTGAGQTIRIVLRDAYTDYGSFTLPVDGFESAGKAAAELFRKPRDKTAVIACP